MAQMTVAVALSSETPDHWSHHYQDTLNSGRGLCNQSLAQLLCEDGRFMDLAQILACV